MNKLDLDYQNLLKDILDNGVKKETRNGGTLSVFGRQIRHKMSDGFPAITTKKLAFKTMVTELLWFLRGDTNIKYLVDNNCHIWDGDAFKNFISKTNEFKGDWPDTMEEFINKIKTDDGFAKKWGELGSVYGAQWRRWEGREWMHDNQSGIDFLGTVYTDQIAGLISELKTNPDSRRLMVSAWNVGELDQMVLPPCHYGFQVYTRELKKLERINIAIERKLTHETAHLTEDFDYQKWCDEQNIPTRAISLMYNCRSQDVPLGTPFNISSYALLLMMIAKQVNMVPDQLIGNLGDCHIYLNQIDGVKEQLTREPYPLPTVKISDRVVNDISEYTLDDIILENYQSHPTIKMPLSN